MVCQGNAIKFILTYSVVPLSLLMLVFFRVRYGTTYLFFFLNMTFLNHLIYWHKKKSLCGLILIPEVPIPHCYLVSEKNVTLKTLHCLNVILLNIFSSRFHCNKAMKVLPTFRPNKQTLANFNYFYIMQKFCIKCLPFPV